MHRDHGFPYPGQRWHSLVDGHTVVTLDQDGDRIFVRFEDSTVATALETAQFVEDYTFAEWCPTGPARTDAATSSRSPGGTSQLSPAPANPPTRPRAGLAASQPPRRPDKAPIIPGALWRARSGVSLIDEIRIVSETESRFVWLVEWVRERRHLQMSDERIWCDFTRVRVADP